jgi:hypothetical protein
MAYQLPVFNIAVNIWRYGVSVLDPPDVVAAANFNVGRRISGGDYYTESSPRQWYATSWLLVPMGTDIRGDMPGLDNGDTVEIAAGSGLFYHVFWSDRSALNFPNEHMAAVVVQLSAPPPWPPAGTVLMEDGTGALMEDGSYIEME